MHAVATRTFRGRAAILRAPRTLWAEWAGIPRDEALRTHQMARFTILAVGPVASMLLAHGAHAQANACDQLKAALVARIDPGIRGYSLEAVPGSSPVPPGAKVIGTCEGGARKILFRRSGSPPSSTGTASAVEPASAPPASAAPVETNRRLALASSDLASQLAATPASVTRLPPGPPAGVAKPLAEVHASGPGAMASAGASDVPSGEPVPAQRDLPVMAGAPFAQRVAEFLGRYWPWMAALALVPLGALLRVWLAHRSGYDAAGLPRGPKLN